MKRILFLLVAISIVGCKSRTLTSTSSNKFIIEDLARVNSAEKLAAIYPNANIEEGTSMFEEATVERAYTRLFPGTNDEVLITWEDTSRTKIHRIRIEKDGKWKSETGIVVGTTYDELVNINKAPVSFFGFGWDYSGAVVYEGGKLDDTNIRVFLTPENEIPNKFYGDQKIEATEEEINDLNLKVGTILYQEIE